MSDERQRRAARRRATWSGVVVALGSETSPLYASMDLQERLRAFVALNRRVWRWAKYPGPARSDRSDWPGEVLDLHNRARP